MITPISETLAARSSLRHHCARRHLRFARKFDSLAADFIDSIFGMPKWS
jgi:hypothetical protein